VLEESAQLGMMSRETGGAFLVATAEVVVVVEEGEDCGEARPPDLGAPAVEGLPVARDVADRGEELAAVHALPGQRPDRGHLELPLAAELVDLTDHLDHVAPGDPGDGELVGTPERRRREAAGGVAQRQHGAVLVSEALALDLEHEQRILDALAERRALQIWHWHGGPS
jgi:hypothetical protein